MLLPYFAADHSNERLAGLDYIAAHVACNADVRSAGLEQRQALCDLCVRILLAHGIPLADGESPDNLPAIRRKTLEVIRPHYVRQRREELDRGISTFDGRIPEFEVRNGWEADVFLSNRAPYCRTVLKIYRFHLLGGNPLHPGYGWVIDPGIIETIASGSQRLPDTHFTPNPTIEKLRSRFFKIACLPFWARISCIRRTSHALLIQQERVAPVKELSPSDLELAARHFLSQHSGVYFTNSEGDLKNVGSVDSAVIVYRSRFYLVQDYYFNLGYVLDKDGLPDQTRAPVMFDGHAFPLTRRYLEQFPSLAQAVMLIHRLYPHVPQDSRMIELAVEIADPHLRHDSAAVSKKYHLYSVDESVLGEPMLLP